MYKLFGTFIAAILVSAGLSNCMIQYSQPKSIDWNYRMASVVRIFSPDGSGSGWVLPDGRIVTADHVVKGNEQVKVELFNGQTFIADVAKESDAADLAVIVPHDKTTKLPAGLPVCGHAPKYADQVWVLGEPLEFPWSISHGIVSNPNQKGQHELLGTDMLQIDAAILPGNSGGPVLEESGCAVGVADEGVSSQVTPQVLVFAVTWQKLQAFLYGV
ncbi:MAG: serine protease [Pseudomonadota bacterium]|nr:serine protease [Pseudomonadota bacterium]